jgi:hypothetical protein
VNYICPACDWLLAKEHEADRRLAAIVAADVAGYSRLIGTDEEGTSTGYGAIRTALIDPNVAEDRGRILIWQRGIAKTQRRCAPIIPVEFVGVH